MCLAHQLSCGHDQPVGMEGAQLFVRAAFVTRAVGGLQPPTPTVHKTTPERRRHGNSVTRRTRAGMYRG